ncbi:sialate O-acetylesterase [Flavobacterium sp.]|uniref:sialate O-acetylesterase n=1 Tax=Flavobacterium sp. TaxID=239 RepID=UPI001B73EFE0|nr:sialate O-acetylesterase [Flavobacterium sp.]MBP6182126.1 9-O-acetylesterase [Flavobacterium sp.]
MVSFKKLWLFSLILCAKLSLTAQIKLPALVSDNMVLQRNTSINLWGWASPNEKISIQLEWQNTPLETIADIDGNWKVVAKTPDGSEKAYSITLEGKNKIMLHNILIGEVWLCSGQSNMFFPVGREEKTWKTGVQNYEEEIKTANYPTIRLFTVATDASPKPLNDIKGNWQICSPNSIGKFSAVGYFFGRDLLQKLNIPIGLISSSWGGTKAEAWTSQQVLEDNPDFSPILERNATKEKDYYTDLVTYYSNIRKQKLEKDKDTELSKTVFKKPTRESINKDPFVLYNAMLYPLINFTIKGVIWYQGESNAERAYQYRSLFPAMIKNWRNDWKQGDFPFYYVQIAPHQGQNAEIREAQLMALKIVPNTGMVVTTDVGDAKNIHPIDKQTVGKRLSLLARAKTYNESNLVYSGPIYNHMKINRQRIQIYFDYADSGLTKKGGELKEFEIAGEDHVFYPAEAEIKGKTVFVFSSKVKKPVAVRFAWKAVPVPNLFNTENLPASPFRTDDWPEKTYMNF